jgi:hypothetical protein
MSGLGATFMLNTRDIISKLEVVFCVLLPENGFVNALILFIRITAESKVMLYSSQAEI